MTVGEGFPSRLRPMCTHTCQNARLSEEARWPILVLRIHDQHFISTGSVISISNGRNVVGLIRVRLLVGVLDLRSSSVGT